VTPTAGEGIADRPWLVRQATNLTRKAVGSRSARTRSPACPSKPTTHVTV